MTIFYYDKSGRKYHGKERICPTCGKKEIVRDSNNSHQCQACARPITLSEVIYIDSNGKKYPGRYKKCLDCGKESIVRLSNKTDYCRKCICKKRKASIKEGELFVKKSGKNRERARIERCSKCGKERLIRNSSKYQTTLCNKCKNYKTGISTYRKTAYKHYKKKCHICSNEENKNVEVHHIDGNRHNNDPKNLFPICSKCHGIFTRKENHGLSVKEIIKLIKKNKRSVMKTKIMDKRNKNFYKFIEELDKKCNFRGEGKDIRWNCEHDHRRCKEILQKHKDIDIDATIKYFERNGGYCDCEILFNVVG